MVFENYKAKLKSIITLYGRWEERMPRSGCFSVYSRGQQKNHPKKPTINNYYVYKKDLGNIPYNRENINHFLGYIQKMQDIDITSKRKKYTFCKRCQEKSTN